MDDNLRELLSSDHMQTLGFFFYRLKDVAEKEADTVELRYTASVLASFAQTSTVTTSGFPTPMSPSSIFDQFVFDGSLVLDSEALENAGAQCLLLSGFFRDQMAYRRRNSHSVSWYRELGGSFYNRAATLYEGGEKRNILIRMSQRFDYWADTCAILSRELRDERYLLRQN